MEVYSLFSIRWDKEWSHWAKVPEYCFSLVSEQTQPPLHKEAANWMLITITAKGSRFANVDYFIYGRLEIIK